MVNVLYRRCSLYSITYFFKGIVLLHYRIKSRRQCINLIHAIDFKTTICTTKKLIYCERYESADSYFQIIFIYIVLYKLMIVEQRYTFSKM